MSLDAVSAGSAARGIKRSSTDGDLSSSSNRKAKRHDPYGFVLTSKSELSMSLDAVSSGSAPRGIKRSFSDSDLSFSKKKAKHHDPGFFLGFESAMVNPASLRRSVSDDAEDPSVSLPSPGDFTSAATANPRVFKIVLPYRAITRTDPEVYLDKAWGKLKPVIKSIFLDEPEDGYSYSCADIHETVTMAWEDKKSGETLLKLIQEECGTYISASIISLEEKYTDDDPSLFLTSLEEYRLVLLHKMKFLCSIAGGKLQRVGGRKLWSILLEILPKQLLLASELCGKVVSKILLMIRDQRSGKSVDMTQLKSLMTMFHGHSFDESHFFFGKALLECTVEFYAAEAIQVFEQSDLPQYLKHVDRRLREEKEKCKSLYFFRMFMDELIAIVEREFLVICASAVIEKGFATLMDENRRADLGRMYAMFSDANLVGHLDEALRSYILETGRKILAQGSSLPDFMASVDQIWFASFLEDPLLEKTVEQCFMELGLPWKDRLAVDMDLI